MLADSYKIFVFAIFPNCYRFLSFKRNFSHIPNFQWVLLKVHRFILRYVSDEKTTTLYILFLKNRDIYYFLIFANEKNTIETSSWPSKSNFKSSQVLDELLHSLKTKTLIWKDICMLVFIAALFPIAQIVMWPKCLTDG